MGIPSYFSYIVKNHNNIIRKLNSYKMIITHFYLDSNSIIYDVIHKAKETPTDEYILQHVIQKIMEYIKEISPTKLVYIAFDGVAPIAKLEQQRQRRYKSWYKNKIIESIYKSTEHIPNWDTCQITPGTKFMNELNIKLKLFFENESIKEQLNVDEIIVSTSLEHGEGEHKIFHYIRNLKYDENYKHVIYGLDADLIMLSINHLSFYSHIYLFRETPEFIKSIHSELEPNETYLMNIPELTQAITVNMTSYSNNSSNKRIHDYIFLCLLLGNDFMPHFPSLNIRTSGIYTLLNAYKVTIGTKDIYLTDGTTIYWKNVKKLVKYLADKEEEYLKKETFLRNKRELHKLPNVTLEDKWKQFENKPTYSRDIEKYINVFNEGWQKRYYKSLFNLNIDDLRKQQICTNYLEGLEWTMKYYTSGCPDWRWCYNYNYPPLLNDLLHYIPYFENEFIINKSPDPVNELVQLCYVLPKQSLNLLPTKLHDKLVEEHDDWYSTNCEFIWAYCKYFWESHVDLPHIDISELELFVKINKV
jgi:5'-3' exonuclease